MKLDQLVETKTLSQWITKFGWQGGTIHQVKDELHKRLIAKCDCNDGEYSCVMYGNDRIIFL